MKRKVSRKVLRLLKRGRKTVFCSRAINLILLQFVVKTTTCSGLKEWTNAQFIHSLIPTFLSTNSSIVSHETDVLLRHKNSGVFYGWKPSTAFQSPPCLTPDSTLLLLNKGTVIIQMQVLPCMHARASQVRLESVGLWNLFAINFRSGRVASDHKSAFSYWVFSDKLPCITCSLYGTYWAGCSLGR